MKHISDVFDGDDQLVYMTCEFPVYQGDAVDFRDFRPEIATRKSSGDDEVRRITFNRHLDRYPSWSPDGSHIAFLVAEEGSVDSEGVNLYSLARGVSTSDRVDTNLERMVAVAPQWSPDGTQIAVVGRAAGTVREWLIVIVGVSGGGGTALTNTVSAPSWSPDGQRLAFANRDGEGVALFTVAADGSDLQHVTWIEHEPEFTESFPAPTPDGWIRTVEWSPSGELLLYACGSYVCVVNLDGARLGRSPRDAYVASWSPDGLRIAVGSPEVQDVNIPADTTDNTVVLALYTMAPDGSNVKPVVLTSKDGVVRGVGARRPQGPVDDAGCATGAAVPNPSVNLGLVSDCKVLLGLRDRLAGSADLNWAAHRPVREWDGVGVWGPPLRVRNLTLNAEGLSGVVPAELGNLSELVELSLSDNYLHGPIPAQLGGLAKLKRLSFNLNLLTGELPRSLAQLADLESLDLSSNQIAGEIPQELGQLDNLLGLGLANNRLTGAIPAELGALSVLRFLNLSDNRLTGGIPQEFVRFTGETEMEIWLAGNHLSGCIPTGLRVSDRDRLGLKEC